MRAGSHQNLRRIESRGCTLPEREKRQVGDHQFTAGAAYDSFGVNPHQIDAGRERGAMAVHDHGGAVADQDRVDRALREQRANV